MKYPESEIDILASEALHALKSRDADWHAVVSDYFAGLAIITGHAALEEEQIELLSLDNARVMAIMAMHLMDLSNGSKTLLPNPRKSKNRPPRGIAMELQIAQLAALIGAALQEPRMRGLSQEQKYRLIATDMSTSEHRLHWKQIRSIWTNRGRLSEFAMIQFARYAGSVAQLDDVDRNRLLIATLMPSSD